MYAAGQDPRRLHQARVAAERPRDPDRAHDRPADPAALAEGLPQRDPGGRDGALGRPGERVRHPLHQRGLGRADALGAALPGPGRRGPHRPGRGRVHHQPDRAGERGVRARPHRRRHRRGHLDGRGGRQGGRRGDDARGPPDRPRGDPAPLRGPGRAAGRRPASPSGRSRRIAVDEKLLAKIEKGAGKDLAEATREQAKLARRDKVAAVRAAAAEKILGDDADPEEAAAFGARVRRPSRSGSSASASRSTRSAPTAARPTRSGRSAARCGVLPRVHGSGLFTRGETQVLTSLALGTTKEAQRIDGLGIETTKRYIHHYNFPPFSVGETGFMRGPKRRDIGHGALAERALLPMIPEEAEFPYTLRLVSETLESNGSSSMASVCGSTLALLDAGVRITRPVAGIAMGLIKEGDELHRAVGHPGRRGPPRRHGLQGGRHVGGHHRPPDGHQDHRRHLRDPARRARPGEGRAPVHPRRHGRDDPGPARRAVAVGAAHHGDQDRPGAHRDRHRQGRRDDPRARGRLRRRDLGGGRRHREGLRRRGPEGRRGRRA